MVGTTARRWQALTFFRHAPFVLTTFIIYIIVVKESLQTIGKLVSKDAFDRFLHRGIFNVLQPMFHSGLLIVRAFRR